MIWNEANKEVVAAITDDVEGKRTDKPTKTRLVNALFFRPYDNKLALVEDVSLTLVSPVAAAIGSAVLLVLAAGSLVTSLMSAVTKDFSQALDDLIFAGCMVAASILSAIGVLLAPLFALSCVTARSVNTIAASFSTKASTLEKSGEGELVREDVPSNSDDEQPGSDMVCPSAC